MASIEPGKGKAEKLVLDSAAFIKQVKIETIGTEFYTIPEVLAEIRDSRARAFLAAFPFEIKQKSPTPAAYKAVVDFSKETGDYPTLSLTDLKVLALTYTLELEAHGNVDHLRKVPQKVVETTDAPPGFFNPSKVTMEGQDDKGEAKPGEEAKDGEAPALTTVIGVGAWDEGDDDEGWITEENIDEYTSTFTSVTAEISDQPLKVACLTLDFAMQNVILQMNMNLVSVDGIHVKSSQRWIRRCYGCHQFVMENDIIYCKNCGGTSLQRISYTVDKDGSVTYHIPKRRRNLRGTKYPVPLPKNGSRHDRFITSPQMLPKQKKKKGDIDLDDPDLLFLEGNRNDMNTPVLGYGKKNPNQARRKIGKKNKSKGREF